MDLARTMSSTRPRVYEGHSSSASLSVIETKAAAGGENLRRGGEDPS